MRVYVTATPTELDELPAGNARSIAKQLRGGADPGRTFTLKADGVVLSPFDRVPADAKVIEVVEHVPDESLLGAPPVFASDPVLEITVPTED